MNKPLPALTPYNLEQVKASLGGAVPFIKRERAENLSHATPEMAELIRLRTELLHAMCEALATNEYERPINSLSGQQQLTLNDARVALAAYYSNNGYTHMPVGYLCTMPEKKPFSTKIIDITLRHSPRLRHVERSIPLLPKAYKEAYTLVDQDMQAIRAIIREHYRVPEHVEKALDAALIDLPGVKSSLSR